MTTRQEDVKRLQELMTETLQVMRKMCAEDMDLLESMPKDRPEYERLRRGVMGMVDRHIKLETDIKALAELGAFRIRGVQMPRGPVAQL